MRRSGELKATNDDLVLQVLNDPLYSMQAYGLILTRVAPTGRTFVDASRWREAGALCTDGYWQFGYRNKKISRARVMYAKFLAGKNGNPELADDLVINHKNGVRNDDRPENLELVSQAANNLHSFRVLKRRPVIGNFRLSFKIAERIRRLKKSGWTHAELVDKFRISKGHVSEIVNHKIWVRPNA